MPLTAKIGKRGQMTLPREVQSIAFVVKNGELTLVPLRRTLFDFKGAVQPRETSDLEEIRERVAVDQAERVARGE
jgi:hypothetical protein